MRTTIVGAGPVGLFTAMALARRGHRVTLVDHDEGPSAQGWQRKAVMQFHHPHAFRMHVINALQAEVPEVWQGLLAAGAEPATVPGVPVPVVARVRRQTYERVLRDAALAEPGVTFRQAHVEALTEGGVRVEGVEAEADLVLVATGRAGKLGDDLRPAGEGGDAGVSYVSRQYRLHQGAEPGPFTSPIGAMASYDGYQVIVFGHDSGTFSTLVVRPTDDEGFRQLREPAAFEAAMRAIPVCAAWTDPERAAPLTPVLPGGRLHNTYRGQPSSEVRVFLGDAVCTTNPAAGRGVALAMQQVQAFLRLLDEGSRDLAGGLDAWCHESLRPWFADHVSVDADLVRRWAGGDVDTRRPLPSDLVCAAAEADPSLLAYALPYFGMVAVPSVLDGAQERAREIYDSGWRPSAPDGPSRDELVDLMTCAVA